MSSTRGSTLHAYDYVWTCSQVSALPSKFSLSVRQQPVQTRQSTNNERERRPIDPPPIVQIKLQKSTNEEFQNFLQNPYYFMSATLVHPTVDEDLFYTPNHSALCGQTVSSMYKLKDINDNHGGFFVFGDLSTRVEGRFRLKFTLFEVNVFGLVNLKSIYSEPFTVYGSKTFPGMLESTFLSRSFADQGVRLRIRKEHRVQITGSRKRKMSSSHDEQSQAPAQEQKDPRQTPPTPTQASTYNPIRHGPTTASTNWYWPVSEPHIHPYDRRRLSIVTGGSGGGDRGGSGGGEGGGGGGGGGGGDSTTSISSAGSSVCHPSPRLPLTNRCGPSVPVSPPHQPYDEYQTAPRRYLHLSSPSLDAIPSPPSYYQSHFLPLHKATHRMSLEPSILWSPSNEPVAPSRRSWSLSSPPFYQPEQDTNIRLPPLRSMIPVRAEKDTVEVDAAVAMMQLAASESVSKPVQSLSTTARLSTPSSYMTQPHRDRLHNHPAV